MKQGTISVLIGCHSPMHSLMVLMAWRKLYGRWPAMWQIACIFLHDIGHWGKDYLDNYEEKKEHPFLGAKIARKLFGVRGYALIAGHTPYGGAEKSVLFEADKYSWVIAPTWWMMTNTIFEPKLKRRGCSRWDSAVMFKQAMRENMLSGFKELGHEIYMRQWGHYKGGNQ